MKHITFPDEYIAVAAYYLWQKRVADGNDGTPAGDWYTAIDQLDSCA